MDQADSVHSTPPTNTSVDMPLDDSGKPVEGLYYPTPVTPEEAFKAIGRLRKEARDEINRLIRFLDETDNHMEREPEDLEEDGGDTEPSLGSFDMMTDQSKSWKRMQGEFGAEDDAEEDDCDDEPSLGSVGNNFSQEQWTAGSTKDLEGEHDGAEPPEDDEPSLGSFDRLLDQNRAWQQKEVWWFTNSDAEHDDAERDR